MKVSILINCYNGEKFLKETLDSVFSQTYKDWEIIFWDNQSTDSSKEILNDYPQENIKYYYAKEFTTLYKARNLAYAKADGDLIAILDTDDIWYPSKLEKIVPLFIEEKVAVAYSDTIYFSELEEWRLYDKRKFFVGQCFRELIKGNFIASPSIVYRKSAIDALDHVFDERFNMSGDWDLSLRLSLNWDLAYCPDALVRYRLHENNLSKKMPEAIVKEANQVIEKYENLIPNFKNKYEKELGFLIQERDFILASTHWSAGQGDKSRIVLRKYLFSPVGILKYFATFFSYKRVEKVRGQLRTLFFKLQ